MPNPRPAPPTQATPGQCDFDEMRPRVGERLEVRLPASIYPPLYTRLLGWAPGESLLVRTPTRDHAPITLQEGQPLVLRCFSGTRVFAFSGRVLRVCTDPYPYLHLSFPEQIRCLTVRDNQRLPLDLLAEARHGETDWRPARLLDLGLGGALLECMHPLGVEGDTVELRFDIPVEVLDEEAHLRLQARIHHLEAHHGPDGGISHRHGLAFAKPPADDALRLENFLLKRLADLHFR